MKNQTNKNQRGVALIFALLALLLLSLIAFSMMYLAETETGVNANFRTEEQSYYAARAGAEEIRLRMMPNDPNTINPPPPAGITTDEANSNSFLPQNAPSATDGILYVTNAGGGPAVAPWDPTNQYFDDELCHEFSIGAWNPRPFATTPDVRCPSTPPGSAVPAGATWYSTPRPGKAGPLLSTAPYNGSSAALPYKWVRVTRKQDETIPNYAVDGNNLPGNANANTLICWNGTSEVLLNAADCESMTPQATPVYVITSMAITPTGARKMFQYEVGRSLIPPVPSALTLDGNGSAGVFGSPHSANFGIHGDDPCQPGDPTVVPAIGTTSDGDATGVAGDLTGDGHKPGNFTGTGGGTPNTANVSGGLSQLATDGQLRQLVDNITSFADTIYDPTTGACSGALTCPSSGMGAPTDQGTQGTLSSAKVTVVTGDYSNCSGEGILLVEGNLNCSGSNASFDGLILVIGKGSFSVSGGGSGSMNGAIFIANIGFPVSAVDPMSGSLPGVPTFNWSGGGKNTLQFNSCDILNGSGNAPRKILAAHEILY